MSENAALRQDVTARDAKIEQLISGPMSINWHQAARVTSLRILGLPTTSSSLASALPEIVFKEIILPCLKAAGAKGEILAQLATIPIQLVISNVFALPAK
jgi:hypothetical protein